MAKFLQNIVSTRFLEVLDELSDKRIVENVADFCKKIDYAPQSMTAIKAGKRDVTIDMISKLFNQFRGNPVYLISGKGDKILPVPSLSSGSETGRRSEESMTIQTLEQLVESKNEIIALLKQENQRMDAELKRQFKG